MHGSGEARGMPFEYATEGGIARLLGTQCQWTIEFNGRRWGRWVPLDDAAKTAAARRMSGLRDWDGTLPLMPGDLLSWRPTGDNL